jgi:predicted DNA-binding transcriptional regulator AlpA
MKNEPVIYSVPLDGEALLVDVRGLARMLAVSTRTVWRLKDLGQLPPHVKIGTAVRWRRADVTSWLEGCRQKPVVLQTQH